MVIINGKFRKVLGILRLFCHLIPGTFLNSNKKNWISFKFHPKNKLDINTAKYSQKKKKKSKRISFCVVKIWNRFFGLSCINTGGAGRSFTLFLYQTNRFLVADTLYAKVPRCCLRIPLNYLNGSEQVEGLFFGIFVVR